MFNPGLNIGQIISNSELMEIFKCGNMGGMRRSKTTNTLVLVSDYTKGIYYDKWIGGILHYTGMGKKGDQDINVHQNATLAAYDRKGVDVHLFEVMDEGEYIYCGRIELVSKPYEEIQPDEDGNERKVWMFPIRPVPDNNVKKPQMFVFEDMEDYKKNGKNVDSEYNLFLAKTKKKNINKKANPEPLPPKVETKEPVVIPAEILGKFINHKKFGNGVVLAIEGEFIEVEFKEVGLKMLEYQTCIRKELIEFY